MFEHPSGPTQVAFWVLLPASFFALETDAQYFIVGHRSLVFLTLALTLAALATLWTAARSARRITVSQWVALGLFLWALGIILALKSGIPTSQGDESLYSRYATEVFLHGGNPYGVDVTHAAQLYGQPLGGLTRTWAGTFSPTYPYPAGMIYFVAMGHLLPSFATPTVAANFIAIVITVFLLIRRCGGELAALFCVLIMMNSEFAALGRGNSDILLVPFLVYLITTIPRLRNSSSFSRIMFVLVFGVFLAMKQSAWLMAPFIVIAVGTFLSTWRERLLAMAAVSVGGIIVFLTLNAPFILRNTAAWIQGVKAPLSADVIVGGEGLSNLARYYGGNLGGAFQHLAIATLVVALLVAPFLRGRASLLIILAGIVPTFLSTRSFIFYLVSMLIVAAVALVSAPHVPSVKWVRGWFVLIPLACVLPGLWATRSTPTNIVVTNYTTWGTRLSIATINLRVDIPGVKPADLNYVAVQGAKFSLPWHVESIHGKNVTISVPYWLIPISTSAPFQVDGFDPVRHKVYASSVVSPAPFEVRVAYGYTTGSLSSVTVNLVGAPATAAVQHVLLTPVGFSPSHVTMGAGHVGPLMVTTGSNGSVTVAVQCNSSTATGRFKSEVIDAQGRVVATGVSYVARCRLPS